MIAFRVYDAIAYYMRTRKILHRVGIFSGTLNHPFLNYKTRH